jgi:hypothetical protein
MSAVAPNVVDEENELALRNAAKDGLLETVRQLITQGVNVNATGKGKTNRTALHWAAKYKHADVCEELLKAGAKPSLIVKDSDKKTPLQLASLEKNNDAVIAVLLKWSGLKNEDLKKITETVQTTHEGTVFDEDAVFKTTKVRAAIHGLKKQALSAITEIRHFSEAYSRLIQSLEINIKKILCKELFERHRNNTNLTLTKEEEKTLNEEFSKQFSIFTLVKRHVEYLERLCKLIDVPNYIDTNVISFFIQYIIFKRDLSAFADKLEERLKKYINDKNLRKKCKKNIDKLLEIAEENLKKAITSMELGFAALLENPKGFIDFIDKYFPSTVLDHVDSYAIIKQAQDETDREAQQEDAIASLQQKFKDLTQSSEKAPQENFNTIVNNILSGNAPTEITDAVYLMFNKTKNNFKERKAKTLPCIEAYFKDLWKQFEDLIIHKKEAILKYNVVLKGKLGDDPKKIVENFKNYIMKYVVENLATSLMLLRNEEMMIDVRALRLSYLFGYRLYSRIEKLLEKMDTAIDDRIQEIMAEEYQKFAKGIQEKREAITANFEEVRLQERRMAKAQEAAKRALSQVEQAHTQALLYQKSLIDDKLQKEAQEKEVWVKKLLGELEVKELKFFQEISHILDPKAKALNDGGEMTKKDFFALVVKLKIPGYEDINIKNNTASENSLVFTLGKFYSFTFHSRHGRDRADFVDKANTAHLKAMFESVGINKNTLWSLASKYSKKEPSPTAAVKK